MSTKFSTTLEPLTIDFCGSLRLRLILAGLGALGAAALVTAAIPWPWRVALGLMAGCYLLRLAAAHTGWPAPSSWRALRWDGRRWLLQDRRAGWLPMTLRQSTVWPGCIALLLAGPGGTLRRVVLVADAMTPETARRLRLHLRWLPVHGAPN